jgi:hypothetical protein
MKCGIRFMSIRNGSCFFLFVFFFYIAAVYASTWCNTHIAVVIWVDHRISNFNISRFTWHAVVIPNADPNWIIVKKNPTKLIMFWSFATYRISQNLTYISKLSNDLPYKSHYDDVILHIYTHRKFLFTTTNYLLERYGKRHKIPHCRNSFKMLSNNRKNRGKIDTPCTFLTGTLIVMRS